MTMEEHELDHQLDQGSGHVSRRSFIEKMGVSTLVAAFLGKEALTEEQTQSWLNDSNPSTEESICGEGETGKDPKTANEQAV